MFETIKYLFRKSDGHLKEIDASLNKTKKDYVVINKDSNYSTIEVKREIHMNDLFDELKYIDSLYISTDAYIKRDTVVFKIPNSKSYNCAYICGFSSFFCCKSVAKSLCLG